MAYGAISCSDPAKKEAAAKAVKAPPAVAEAAKAPQLVAEAAKTPKVSGAVTCLECPLGAEAWEPACP